MPGVFRLAQDLTPQRVLVVMPTWLGDCVMAMPTLRAMRGLYPQAEMVALVRRGLEPMLEPCSFVDAIMTTPRVDAATANKRENVKGLARRLAERRFDLAVLMPNSFRVAAMAKLAGIPHRVGYSRDGRGGLLTDRLLPPRERGRFLPMPALEYYLALARYLGAVRPDPTMALSTTAEDDQRAMALLGNHGPHQRLKKFVVLNPGAQKPAKRWPIERFAKLADHLAEQQQAVVAVTGSPDERALVDQVIAAATGPILDLTAQGMDLRLAKAVIGQADLLITGDTGPRHIAAALDTPVLTLFGPTDPQWTRIHFTKERQLIAPGQLETADDSDHRCPPRHMGLIEVEAVYDAARDLLEMGRGA